MAHRQMKTLTIDGKTYDIAAGGGEGGVVLQLIFPPPVEVGADYTLQGGGETWSGTVPASRTVLQPVSGLRTRYTAVCGLFTAHVTTENYYGRYDLICGEMPTWGGGTEEQIAWVVDGLDRGLFTPEATGWHIGDERTVYLSAMEAQGVEESHGVQSVVMTLMDSGHYELAEPSAAVGGRDHFVVGLKEPLAEPGSMNIENNNQGSWHGSARRSWCNTTFRNAVPAALRGCFKKFRCVTAEVYNGNTLKTSEDYFALFAEKEVFGGVYFSNRTEADALTQIRYYTETEHRRKSAEWWERSPRNNSPNYFCSVNTLPDYEAGFAAEELGLAPFGCI